MERVGLQPGTEVGGYRIVAPLGSGGMGHVYRAVDGGGTAVALKLLHPHIGADPEARERLRREVTALQRLRHPAVASVLDAEADSTEAFIVTELVDGPTLEESVRRTGALDAAALANLAEGLDDALDAVHRAGVVHRDLKPSNVLVTDDGPVLIDFGLAQGAGDARVTSAGLVVGTPGYLAPELLDDADPTPASDRWGMAALLAFAATGREPFGTRPLEAVLARARSGGADLAGLGPGTERLLRAALDPNPQRRPDPAVLVDGLREIALDGEPEAAEAAESAGTESASTEVLPVSDTAGRGDTVRVLPTEAPLPPLPPAPTAPLRTAPPPPPTVEIPDPVWASQSGAPVRDGSTQVLAVGAEAWDGQHGQHGHGAPGHDDLGEGDGFDGDGDEDEGYDPVEPAPRRFVVAVLAVVAVACAAWFPGVSAIVVAGAFVLAHATDSGAQALERRRVRRGGPGRGERARATLAAPWHLLRGLALALPSVLIGASVAVLLGGLAWWLLESGRVVVPTASQILGGDSGDGGASSNVGSEPWAYVGVVALAALAGLVTAWWGPVSAPGRRGARRVLAHLAPGSGGTAIVVGLALAGLAVLAALALTGQQITWWPLPEPQTPY